MHVTEVLPVTKNISNNSQVILNILIIIIIIDSFLQRRNDLQKLIFFSLDRIIYFLTH